MEMKARSQLSNLDDEVGNASHICSMHKLPLILPRTYMYMLEDCYKECVNYPIVVNSSRSSALSFYTVEYLDYPSKIFKEHNREIF